MSKDSSSPPEVFLEKGVLKICSKIAGEHCKFAAYSRKAYRKTGTRDPSGTLVGSYKKPGNWNPGT